MKRIIYTAVALITCASVFGIADYLSAKKRGGLVDYTDDDQSTVAVTPVKKQVAPAAKEVLRPAETKREIVKKEAGSGKTFPSKNKPVHYATIIPNAAVTDKTKDPVIEKIDPVDMLLSKTTIQKADSSIQQEDTRHIRMEMFSRAPLRIKKKKS